ncbi:MAG TPA: glycosyltransferase family 2 protein [Bacteroidia bacterium]|nr:glycosyltransferase family 2 protein [Bacteroidia bacterium]
MTKVVVHILCRNEEQMLPYTMRHYRDYCAEIFLHDLGSTDRSIEIARSFGATVKEHDSGGEFRDALNKKIKDQCWLGTDADWVVVVDCDELLHFGAGVRETLKCYDEQQVAVVKPIGYEMCSETFPTGSGQITEYVKHGKLDLDWYSKPCCFSPKRVAATDFGAGAHTMRATLHGGRQINVTNATPPNSPAAKLLHMHHLGSVEEIGAKYEAVISRLSPENRRLNQGIQRDGAGHSRDKRRAIMAKLERVLA